MDYPESGYNWTDGHVLPDGANYDMDYPSLEVVEPAAQTFLVVLFSITATLSLTGNITVIIVLSLGKRSSKDLRPFLINLAISDVTMAVFSIPFTYTMFLLGRWVFAPWFCPIVMTMQHLSVLTSVYTLTAIGIDRYRAVLHPLNRRVRKSRNKLVIGLIWVVSFFIASIQLFVARAEPFKYDGKWHYECTEIWTDPENSKAYTVFVFTVTFLLPLCSMGFTYYAIARAMMKRDMPGNADQSRDLAHAKAKTKVIRMLVTLVILFAICWLPLQAFNLIFYFIPEVAFFQSESHKTLYAMSYFGCLWLANANSFINPMIYSFMSDNFRTDVKEVFIKLCCFKKKRRFTSSERSGFTRSTVVCRDPGRASYKKNVSENEKHIELSDIKKSSAEVSNL